MNKLVAYISFTAVFLFGGLAYGQAIFIDSISPVRGTCGVADGELTIHATGGSSQLIFSIDNGATQQSDSLFTGLTPGVYQIVVSDSSGVAQTLTYTLYGTGGITATTLNIANVTCFGYNDGQVDLQVSGGTPPYVYEHIGGVTQSNGLFIDLPGGNASFAYIDAAYCTDTLDVLVPEPALLTVAPVVTEENCPAADGSIVLNVSGGNGGYQHSINGGATYQVGNTFLNLSSGGYITIVTDQNGCADTGAVILNSAPGTGPMIVTLNYISPLCFGSDDGSITVVGTGTNPIDYSVDAGQNFQSNSTFTGLAPGLYAVMVRDGNGCQVGNVVDVIEPDPLVNDVVYFDETCNPASNGSITFNLSGGTIPYQYSIDNGATFVGTSSFTSLSGGTYNYLVTDNNGCQDSGVVTLNSGGGPTLYGVTIEQPTCPSTSDGLLVIDAASQVGVVEYSINGGATLVLTDSFPNLGVGNYVIYLQDVNGCITTQNITIGAPPAPFADLTANPVTGLAPLDVNFFNNSINESSVFWNFGDGVGNSTQNDPTYTYTSGGTYTVLLTASDGLCLDTASIQIVVEGEPSMFVPNVFTPNGDGDNDFFYAKTVGITQLSGVVFNRWGEEVYKWEGYNGGWDGHTYPAGVACPEGTYFYVISGITVTGEELVEKGTVTLLRQNERVLR